MAKQDVGFVDKHMEKAALGACALALLGAVWFSFMSHRFAVNGETPSEIAKKIGDESESVARTVRNATFKADESKETDSKDDPSAQLARWYGEDSEGLIQIAGLQANATRTQPFGTRLLSTSETSMANRHNLAQMVAPRIPIITTGRTGFHLPEEKLSLEEYEESDSKGQGSGSVRNWVAVAAQVDLVQQDINFISEKYPPGSFPEIVKVRMQRRDETEPWRGWQEVDTYLPFERPERPTIFSAASNRFTLEGLSAFRNLIASKQKYIARPKLPERGSGDSTTLPGLPYFPEPPSTKKEDKRARQWLSLGRAAEAGKRAFKDGADLDLAYILARAVINSPKSRAKEVKAAEALLKKVQPKFSKTRAGVMALPSRQPERLMPIVAYDMTAIPGHRYVYRMRYEVYNTYAGNRGELLNRDDAKRLTVMSEWSPRSRVVEIDSDVRFFLTKANTGQNKVTITVFKRKGKEWRKEEFKIGVGDKIGDEIRLGRNKGTNFNTDTVCVDIDFSRRVNGKKDVALVYTDTNDGSLRERFLSSDKTARFLRDEGGRRTARR